MKPCNHVNKIHNNFLLQFLVSKPHGLSCYYLYSIDSSGQGKAAISPTLLLLASPSIDT